MQNLYYGDDSSAERLPDWEQCPDDGSASRTESLLALWIAEAHPHLLDAARQALQHADFDMSRDYSHNDVVAATVSVAASKLQPELQQLLAAPQQSPALAAQLARLQRAFDLNSWNIQDQVLAALHSSTRQQSGDGRGSGDTATRGGRGQRSQR